MSVNDPSTPASGDFAEAGPAIEATRRDPGRSGFFFDFDGTLSPIVPDPTAALPAPGAVEALAELARLVGKVAIVSARPVDFLAERLAGLPGALLYGLYGLESRTGDGTVVTHPDAAPFEPLMASLAQRAIAELPAAVLVEFKRLGVALHYRTAQDLRSMVERWANDRAAELGLRLQPGRMVIELKPPAARDKGTVVAEQLAGLSCAWYFGDDVSDLRAFAALDQRQRSDEAFVGVRVAVANPETWSALSPAADLALASPAAVPDLIKVVLAALHG